MTQKIVGILMHQAASRKRALELKLRELVGASHMLDELQIERLADPLDQIQSHSEREIAIHRLDHQAQLIHAIESAIAKISTGEYGVCENCEEPISSKRLDAVPWATMCVACQSEAETATRHEAFTFQDAA
jgi:DnaK suppressor protein